MNNALLFLLGVAIICTLGAASGPSDDAIAWTEYCEMVALHNETGGQYGWPDFKDVFEDECQ